MRMLRKSCAGGETDLLGVRTSPEENPVQEMKGIIKEILIHIGVMIYAAIVAGIVYYLL